MGYSENEEPHSVGTATPMYESGSGLAIRMNIEDVGPEWVPRKGIHDNSEVWEVDQEAGELIVKGWLAREKGWS